VKIASGEKIEYAVYNSEKIFVGLISLRDLKTPTPEFGLWIQPDYQGQGYGTQSIAWLIDWARTHTEATSLIYDAASDNAASDNAASVALARRAGLIFQGEYDDSGVMYSRFEAPLD
jgi:RimJ/RimL family protein N-acetyltransferase